MVDLVRNRRLPSLSYFCEYLLYAGVIYPKLQTQLHPEIMPIFINGYNQFLAVEK